ncbi:MAG TPA: hypothetical protein VEZ90_05290 [Blastocatellia bacterium]|nr:hypothetical protein [Blastocatellia bacterium]
MNLLVSLLAVAFAFCSCSRASVYERPTQGQTETQAAKTDNRSKESGSSGPARTAPVDPNRFAIVIAGVGGEESFTKRFTNDALRMYQLLTTRYGFAENNTLVLTENGPQAVIGAEDGFIDAEKVSIPPSMARSTAEEVRGAFAKIKAAAKPDSLVLIILMGHGSGDADQAKFNLPGPDLSARDYAALIAPIPARRLIFIDCSSASGGFIKPLSGPNRIIITATRSSNEQNATAFAENLIAAFSDPAADTNKDGRLSVLEAFNFATKATADYYNKRGLLATEHAVIDDNGDGTGHESATGGDGPVADATFLDSQSTQEAASDPELAGLLKKKQSLEDQIAQLKARKDQMKPDEYQPELERLLVELAKVDQQIRSHKK